MQCKFRGRNTVAVTKIHSRKSGQLKCVFILFIAAHGHLYLGSSFSPIRGFQYMSCSTIHLLGVCSQWFFHIAEQKHFAASELACLIMGCCEIQTLLTSEVKELSSTHEIILYLAGA